MRAGAAVRRLRPVLAAALLALPLFAGLTGGAAAQTAVQCTSANSDGSYSVPSDWALKPSGLNAGDKFRLLFVTSTERTGLSSNIADYNTFVQTAAKAGHSAITDSCGNLFKVLGSTATVDARNNAGTTGAGFRIYWLGGAKVADSYTDFHDGSWDSSAGRNENGVVSTSSFFSGSNDDGTAIPGRELGQTVVRAGAPSTGLDSGIDFTSSPSTQRFLAISPVFHVGTFTPPTGSLTFSPTSVMVEEGGTATYTVRLGTAPTGTVTVTPSSNNGDVTFAPASLTFTTGNWSSPKMVTVSAGMDNDLTDDTATISHSASGGGYDSVTGNVGVTVTDNDVARLLFSTTSLLVTEGGSTTYRVRLGMMPSGTVTVTPSRTGSSDVTFAPPTLTFTTGNWNSWQTVTVSASEDSDQDNDEATLSHGASGGGYHALTGNVEVAVTVNDNDVLPPCTNCVWITGGSDITEGGDANFTVHANPAPSADMTVRLVVFDARGLSDFLNGGDSFSKQVTIPRGTTAAMYTVTTRDDSTHEADGDVRVRISSGRAGGKTFWRHDPYTASVRVRDNDAALPAHVPPNISISTLYGSLSGSRTVTEGTRGYFCVTIDGPNPGGTSLSDRLGAFPSHHPGIFRVAVNITDSSGQIVPRWGSNSMQFHRDHWNKDEATRANCLYFDTDGAEGETYTARVIRGGRVYSQGRIIQLYETGHMTSASITVVRPMSSPGVVPPDGQLPAVTISAGGTSVTEGGDATFTVSANPAPAFDLVVHVSAEEEMGSGDDRVAVGHLGTVTIRAGTASATWTVTTTGDEVARADGTVAARIQSGYDYTVGKPFEVTVTLLDDDGVTTQSVPDSVVGVDPALVALVRGYAAETWKHPDHVKRWMRVLAAFGDDNGYTPMTAAEAQTHADKGWQRWVPVAAALAALEAAQQPLTLPAVSVSAGADVTEGGDAVFTVTANPAPASPLSVTVTVATAGEFGVTAGTQTVPIPTTGSATLTLATSNDEVDETDGSVSVTVAAGDGYTVGDPASGTVAIADDDLPLPAIAVSAGDAVTEGGDATFTVTASPAPASPLAVSVTVAAEGDYGIAAGTRTVSIPTAGSATLTLATSDDDADEPDGSVTLTVAAGDGYTVGDPASGSVSIADDDLPPPAVSIAAKAASVTEGGAAAFTLTADRAPDADLTVTLSVAETGGGDHVAAADEGPATAVIAKGATEAAFSVATVDDDVDEPDGSVTVTLKDGGGYTVSPSPGDAAAVTVSDNDAAALPSLSVADVTIEEDAWMEFTVRLSAPSTGGVSVKVSTRDSTPVSATARKDYWPLSGRTVSFRAGETERSVGVIVFDDSHDEEAETFEVVLSDARGAAIADGVAVGTITNDDPMPAAWLARFGRTVAEQALDGIAGRMSADRTPGMHGSIAGQALSFDPAANDNPGSRSGASAAPSHAASGSPAFGGTGALALADVAQAFGGQSGHSVPGGFGHDAAGFANGTQSQTMTARDALLGSSFSLTGAADGSGGSMAFWGRAAQGGFDGREGTFSLDGTVTTGMLGADYARGKWLVGLALAQSAGEGDYRDSDVSPRPDGQTCPDGVDSGLCSGAVRAGDGSVEASLTAAIPYAALQASERLKLWGAAGYGTGEVTLKTALGGSYKADTSWSMAAAGLRGDLLAPPAEGSGPALAVTSDALWTRSSSEKTSDLAASESDATRLRLGLEGSYRMALEGGGSLVPKLEIGMRHDGGDAETGFGVELGGGVAWSAPALGLSLDVSGRTLIAHGNDDLKDRGYAASLAFDPDPATQRGPSLSLRQEFGGQAQGGLDALFQPAALEDRTGSEATSRWTAEAAYGFPAFAGRWTGSPHVGLGLATATRDYSVGWRLTPAANANAPDVSFGLRATRRESDAQAPEHTVGFEATARW